MTSERTADAERERAERHKALLEDCEPVGMVSEPHICAFSDALSVSHRDVLSLVARNQQLQEALAGLTAAAEQYLDTDRGDLDGWIDAARAALASVRARTP